MISTLRALRAGCPLGGSLRDDLLDFRVQCELSGLGRRSQATAPPLYSNTVSHFDVDIGLIVHDYSLHIFLTVSLDNSRVESYNGFTDPRQ